MTSAPVKTTKVVLMLLLNVDYKKNLINNYTYSEFNVNNKDMHSEICSR